MGINCSMGPAEILPIAKKLVKWTDLPVLVQPNAGLPEVVEGQTVYGVGPEEFAAYAKKLIEAGVSILGGCCGTTPEHIRMVAQNYCKQWNPNAVIIPNIMQFAHRPKQWI